LLVGLKLKGTKISVTRKKRKDSTGALFVWTMDIIGIIKRGRPEDIEAMKAIM
jgi:hypothetical protein